MWHSEPQNQYPNIFAMGTLIRIKRLQQPWQLYQDEIPVLLNMPFLLCNHYSEDTFLHLPHLALSTLRFKSFSIFHSPPSQDSLISYGNMLWYITKHEKERKMTSHIFLKKVEF
jgi:hypothetical protein